MLHVSFGWVKYIRDLVGWQGYETKGAFSATNSDAGPSGSDRGHFKSNQFTPWKNDSNPVPPPRATTSCHGKFSKTTRNRDVFPEKLASP
jgi:hypothetical protein